MREEKLQSRCWQQSPHPQSTSLTLSASPISRTHPPCPGPGCLRGLQDFPGGPAPELSCSHLLLLPKATHSKAHRAGNVLKKITVQSREELKCVSDCTIRWQFRVSFIKIAIRPIICLFYCNVSSSHYRREQVHSLGSEAGQRWMVEVASRQFPAPCNKSLNGSCPG